MDPEEILQSQSIVIPYVKTSGVFEPSVKMLHRQAFIHSFIHSFFFFQTESYSATLVVLEFMAVLMLQPLTGWYDRRELPCYLTQPALLSPYRGLHTTLGSGRIQQAAGGGELNPSTTDRQQACESM